MNIIVGNNILKDVELMVFDKDGTILDLHTYWRGMIAMRAGLICEMFSMSPDQHKDGLMDAMGIDVSTGKIKPGGPVGILPRGTVCQAAERYLALLGVKAGQSICEEAFNEADKMSLPKLDELVKPFPGAIELLKKIKDNGGENAIATTDITNRAELVMRFIGADKYIDLIVGADKVSMGKPNPDMLNYITEELGISNKRSVMVGDAVTDVEMGKNAGFMASIGLRCGITPEKDLAGYSDFIMDDISGITVKC